MARTKKIGLKSNHSNAPPAASRQPVAIDIARDCSELPDPAQKTEPPVHLDTTVRMNKTYRKDEDVNAQSIMPQAGKFKAQFVAGIRLTLSVDIGSNSNPGEVFTTGQKTGFLDLPLELRAMIYNYVLVVDNDTYEVAHFTCSSWSEIEHRHNFHRVTNIKHNHFALLTINHQIVAEVKASVPAKSFNFTSTYALDNFLFCEEHEVPRLMMANFNVLCKAKEIVVIVGKKPFSRAVGDHCIQLYDTMTELLPKPLHLVFVAENTGQSIELVCILFACTLDTTQRLTNASSIMPDALEGVGKEEESHAVVASLSIGSSVQRSNSRSLHLYHDSQVYSFRSDIVGIAQGSKFRCCKEEATRVQHEEKVKSREEEKNFRSKGRRKLISYREGLSVPRSHYAGLAEAEHLWIISLAVQ